MVIMPPIGKVSDCWRAPECHACCGTCMLNNQAQWNAIVGTFRIDSSRPLKHLSKFRLIFATLGRGAGGAAIASWDRGWSQETAAATGLAQSPQSTDAARTGEMTWHVSKSLTSNALRL